MKKNWDYICQEVRGVKNMRNKDGYKSFIASLIAIIIGLLIGFVVILIANPGQAFKAISILLNGGFYKGLRSTGQVLYTATPIMMTGLSVAFAFKCGNFNIGTTGQYTVGAFVALVMANTLCDTVPNSILWILCLLCAGIAGALWALIPGILKAYRNVNIVISGIMFNYIGMLLVIEGVKKFIYDKAGARSQVSYISIPKFGLDKIFRGSDVNGGIIIAILLCILAYIILNKTTFGYELKACGYNPDASQYAGMSEKKIVITSMLISGFFSGIGGGLVYIAGTGRALYTSEVLLPEGFNGIPVALLGMNSPIGCIGASLFIAYINVGGNYMQACNIPVEIIDVISAVIIYFSSFALMIKLYLENRGKKKIKMIESTQKGEDE